LKAERFGVACRLGNRVRQRRERPKARTGRGKHTYLKHGDAELQPGWALRKPLGMTETSFGEADRFRVGEQPQRAFTCKSARVRCHIVILSKRGMMSNIRCEGAVALDDGIQGARNSPMQQLSPRLRERTIGRLADEIVREVVSIAADRPNQPAPLQFAKGREKLGIIETRRSRKVVRREGAAMGCRPDQRLAYSFRKRRELAGDQGFDGPTGARVPTAVRTGEFQTEQRVAAAFGKDLGRVE
jgi:hypothetical protein